MSAAATRRTILAIMASDATFERIREGLETAGWRGKCLHCRTWLYIADSGEPISNATIEHIVPRSHGGDDSLRNLALACARCNHGKGIRHDAKRKLDEAALRTIAVLKAERERRWREPQEP